MLAVLKSGGAYIPLDPIYPADRIKYILEDAEAIVLITDSNLVSSLDNLSVPIVALDREAEKEKIKNQDPSYICKDVHPDNLAYVIYTSGSTGKPKGVQIQHRAIVNFLWSMYQEPALNSKDILLSVTTISFDIAGLELYLPLIAGAKLVISPPEQTADGKALISALEKHEVTMMQATPSTWRIMLAAGWNGKSDLKILCGGESLPKDLAKQLLPRCLELWNMYGPTETTVWSTCARIEDEEDIHIGQPIANTDVYIVDNELKLVPIGAKGELLIGGDGLAKCYHKRAGLTEEKFIDHPFKKGMKIFRTGDVARYRADGTIDCLGRMDNQVKIRGYRIELGEIEAVLSQNNQVFNSVVVAHEDLLGDKQLVAYIALKDRGPIGVEALREYLTTRLPGYMIPSSFVFLEKLPLTPNGKIDRKALPEPDGRRPEMIERYIAPVTAYEKSISEILCRYLCVDSVGVNDNFFDLGGNSAKLVQVQIALEEDLGISVQVAKLFQYPTIKTMACFLSEGQDDRVSVEDIHERSRMKRDALNRRRRIGSRAKLSNR